MQTELRLYSYGRVGQQTHKALYLLLRVLHCALLCGSLLCSLAVGDSGSSSNPERVCWSRRQAELFIAQQASLMQTNEMAALSPPELQERIKELLQANPEYAEAVCFHFFIILFL